MAFGNFLAILVFAPFLQPIAAAGLGAIMWRAGMPWKISGLLIVPFGLLFFGGLFFAIGVALCVLLDLALLAWISLSAWPEVRQFRLKGNVHAHL